MFQIRQMDKKESYEVLDLWLRATTTANSFIENDFWVKNYDKVKNEMIKGMNNLVYVVDGKILGFVSISNNNRISGLFVDPAYENSRIGSELIAFAKTEYAMLQMNVYAKNKTIIHFCTNNGFLIDGALLNPQTNEIQYTMIWHE